MQAPKPLSPAATPSRAEAVAAVLEEYLAGLEPGDRIGTKEDLRRQLGVAVSTMTEAVRLLQAKRIVTVRPGVGGGLFVASRPPMVQLGNALLSVRSEQATVQDAIRVRDSLDPVIIEDALHYRSDADVIELQSLAADMTAAVDDNLGFIKANWALHRRMAEITPNVVLRSIYQSLLDVIEQRTESVTGDTEYLRERADLHLSLVEAVAQQDRDLAERLARDHAVAPAAARG